MSDFEDDVMKPLLTPLILGRAALLSVEDCRDIVRWAVMKSMVAEFLDKGIDSTTVAARGLIRSGYVPPFVEVWIGKNETIDNAHIWQQFAVLAGRAVPGPRRNAQFFVISIGYVSILAFTSTGRILPASHQSIPSPVLRVLTANYKSLVSWPPPTTSGIREWESAWRATIDAVSHRAPGAFPVPK